METKSESTRRSRDTVYKEMVGIVTDMTSDWDTGFERKIDLETSLIADLGFESIDVVQLVVAIETHFQRRDFPFEELLMSDGRYVDELTIQNTVDFLEKHL